MLIGGSVTESVEPPTVRVITSPRFMTSPQRRPIPPGGCARRPPWPTPQAPPGSKDYGRIPVGPGIHEARRSGFQSFLVLAIIARSVQSWPSPFLHRITGSVFEQGVQAT